MSPCLREQATKPGPFQNICKVLVFRAMMKEVRGSDGVASSRDDQRKWSKGELFFSPQHHRAAPSLGLLMLRSGEASISRLRGRRRCWEPAGPGEWQGRPFLRLHGSGRPCSTRTHWLLTRSGVCITEHIVKGGGGSPAVLRGLANGRRGARARCGQPPAAVGQEAGPFSRPVLRKPEGGAFEDPTGPLCLALSAACLA